jgi:hypothetical protein
MSNQIDALVQTPEPNLASACGTACPAPIVSPTLFAEQTAAANRLAGKRRCKKSKHHSAQTPNTRREPGDMALMP